MVEVLVALVPRGLRATSRGAVLRRVGDQGIPVLVLRSTGATTSDLAIGLRLAAWSAHQQPTPVKATKTEFRSGANVDRMPTRIGPAYLVALGKADFRTIKGLGSVQAMPIATTAWKAR